MKCRQKKKQQFQELVESKAQLEAENTELQEKVCLINTNTHIQYDNIQKQFSETKEENDDLKKRLDFMEKQQEILFSIVSENNRNRSLSHPPYQQQVPLNSIVSQIEPVIKLNMDGRLGSPKNSAFKPSANAPEAVATASTVATPLVNQVSGVSAPATLANENLNSLSQLQLCQKLNYLIRNTQ